VASPRGRKGADGLVWWTVRYRDPGLPRGRRDRTLSLGPVPEAVAQAEAERVTCEIERRRPSPAKVPATRALDRFLGYWRDVLRRSPKTVRFYDQLLRPCFLYLSARGPMSRWRAAWLEDYIRERREWSAVRVRALVVALRTFGKYARRNRVAFAQIAEDFAYPTVERTERAAYSREDVRAILSTAKETGHYLYPAIALAFWAGLDLGDVRRVTRRAIEKGAVEQRRGKTGRRVLVPLSRPLREALRGLGPGSLDEPALMCPRANPCQPYPRCRHLPVSDSSTYKAWSRLCRRAGVDPTGGFKRLRHTFRTLLGAARVDTATARDLMRGRAPSPGARPQPTYSPSGEGAGAMPGAGGRSTFVPSV
jgi:integrase